MNQKIFFDFLLSNYLNYCSEPSKIKVQKKSFEKKFLRKESKFKKEESEKLQQHKKEVAENIEAIKFRSRCVGFLLKDDSLGEN